LLQAEVSTASSFSAALDGGVGDGDGGGGGMDVVAAGVSTDDMAAPPVAAKAALKAAKAGPEAPKAAPTAAPKAAAKKAAKKPKKAAAKTSTAVHKAHKVVMARASYKLALQGSRPLSSIINPANPSNYTTPTSPLRSKQPTPSGERFDEGNDAVPTSDEIETAAQLAAQRAANAAVVQLLAPLQAEESGISDAIAASLEERVIVVGDTHGDCTCAAYTFIQSSYYDQHGEYPPVQAYKDLGRRLRLKVVRKQHNDLDEIADLHGTTLSRRTLMELDFETVAAHKVQMSAHAHFGESELVEAVQIRNCNFVVLTKLDGERAIPDEVLLPGTFRVVKVILCRNEATGRLAHVGLPTVVAHLFKEFEDRDGPNDHFAVARLLEDSAAPEFLAKDGSSGSGGERGGSGDGGDSDVDSAVSVQIFQCAAHPVHANHRAPPPRAFCKHIAGTVLLRCLF